MSQVKSADLMNFFRVVQFCILIPSTNLLIIFYNTRADKKVTGLFKLCGFHKIISYRRIERLTALFWTVTCFLLIADMPTRYRLTSVFVKTFCNIRRFCDDFQITIFCFCRLIVSLCIYGLIVPSL